MVTEKEKGERESESKNREWGEKGGGGWGEREWRRREKKC